MINIYSFKIKLSGCPTPCFKETKQERPQGLTLLWDATEGEIDIQHFSQCNAAYKKINE